jgi:urease accessory protein
MNFMPARDILTPPAQRAKGRLALSFKRATGTTRIQNFYQEGCLKTRLPRPVNAGLCEAVTMNIGGGIAGGDVLTTDVELHPNAHASIASQSAERVYRALAEPSWIATSITLHAGASLEYLPQETILFDGFGLRRSLDIDMPEDAGFLGVESLIFGRLAMGESVNSGSLRDRITLRRGGQLILQDMTRLEGDVAAQLNRTAIGAGARATAAIILATPNAPAKLSTLREALEGAHAGASCLQGIVFARILAPNGATLRRIVISALNILRDHRALPRVWQG